MDAEKFEALLNSTLAWIFHGIFNVNTLFYFLLLFVIAWVMKGFQNYFNKRFDRIEMMIMYMNDDPRYKEEIRELFNDKNYHLNR